jgi:hypothetical protein
MAARSDYIRAFLRGDPNAIVPIAPYLLLGGMASIGIIRQFDGVGVITAVLVMGLGAAGAGLETWRTERGLWMLAGLLLLMYGAIYVGFCIGQLQDVLRGAQPPETLTLIDFSIGTAVLAIVLRFLTRVVIENYSNKFDQAAP